MQRFSPAFALLAVAATVLTPVARGQEDDRPAVGTGSLAIELDEPIAVGTVRVALHASPDTFRGGRPAFGGAFAPGQPIRIEGVAPGTYGLVVHHDEDGDGQVARNFLGIPTEPLGFANQYRPTGPPSYERSLVRVEAGGTTLERIELARLLGENGSIGVGVGAVVQGLPYRGASGARINPIPIVTYVSENLAVVGPQITYSMARSGRTRVAATLRARFPAYDEDDADVLEGLGDRDIAALAGVQVDVGLTDTATLSFSYEHDILDTIGGGEATVSLRRSFDLGAMSLTPSFGARWTAEDLVAHDFGVPTSAALPGRPAYAPGDAIYFEAGVASRTQLTDDLQLVLNLGAQWFDDEVTDSPIVEDDLRVSGVVGLVYSF